MKDKDLIFLCNRIKNLGTAIVSCFNKSKLPFYTNIIELSHVGDDGTLWFIVENYGVSIGDFEKESLTQLHFYNRHFNYFISVIGTVRFIAEMVKKDKANQDRKTICVTIRKADYYYRKPEENHLRFFSDRVMRNLFAIDNVIIGSR